MKTLFSYLTLFAMLAMFGQIIIYQNLNTGETRFYQYQEMGDQLYIQEFH